MMRTGLTSSNTATTTVLGNIAAGSQTTVGISFTITADATGSLTNFAEIDSFTDIFGNPQTDVDSSPDNDPNNDGSVTDGEINNANGDEDDHDPETITIAEDDKVYDLALTKSLAFGQPSTVGVGDVVNYTITVYNQGSEAVSNVSVNDYFPSGLILNDAGWTLTAANTATTTVAGTIAAGGSTSVNISFIITDAATGSLTNYAEIGSFTDISGNPQSDVDSTPDNNAGNDGPVSDNEINNANGDEDDHDPATISLDDKVYDLALVKSLVFGQPSTVGVGDVVNYTITVYNQGSEVVSNVSVNDYFPSGLTLNDGSWLLTAANTATTTVAGTIAAGSSTSVNISFIITDAATGSLTNFAEIGSFTDEDGNPQTDVDSTPDNNAGNDGSVSDDEINNANGDEDDHDPATISLDDKVYDLALTKSLAFGQPSTVGVGDAVNYTITVYNQGSEAVSNVSVNDYFPSGLILNDGSWTLTAANTATTTVVGTIAAGGSTSVNISFIITDAATGSLTNFAEIGSFTDEDGNPQTDVDSSPDNDPNNDGPVSDGEINNNNGDEDDHDPETITVADDDDIFDLALVIDLVSTGSFAPGDDVTYSVLVSNQGNVDASSYEITNYIPEGMSFDPADNPGWVLTGPNTVAYAGGDLPAGTADKLQIVLSIEEDFEGGSLINYAEISNDANTLGLPDIDSNPDATNGNDAGGAPNSSSDNATAGDGSGIPGDTNAFTDEDDHDPAIIEVGTQPVIDCAYVAANNLDICAYISVYPQLGDLDCDGGGVINSVECANGDDPSNPSDDVIQPVVDCDYILENDLNICAFIALDPTGPLAFGDCDGGGAINLYECKRGEDPFDPSDDCIAIMEQGADICTEIISNPVLAGLDCDNGGVSNGDECAAGTDLWPLPIVIMVVLAMKLNVLTERTHLTQVMITVMDQTIHQ